MDHLPVSPSAIPQTPERSSRAAPGHQGATPAAAALASATPRGSYSNGGGGLLGPDPHVSPLSSPNTSKVSATAASPFIRGDPDSPRLRPSTLAYGPRSTAARAHAQRISPYSVGRSSTPSSNGSGEAAAAFGSPGGISGSESARGTITPASETNSTIHTPGRSSHEQDKAQHPATPGSALAASAGAGTVPITPRSQLSTAPAAAANTSSSSTNVLTTPAATASTPGSTTGSSHVSAASSHTTPSSTHTASGTHKTLAPPAFAGPVTPQVAHATPSTERSSSVGHTRSASGSGHHRRHASQSRGHERTLSSSSHARAQSGTPAAAPRKPQKRTSIGPWDFVKSIGAGSMGQVKLAVHRYTRQPAAVKIVPKAFTQRSRDGRELNEAKDARVIRESAIGRLLDHPNISKLYDVYSMTGHFYLVFEYISGGQMLDYIITHGCVKEVQARRFARSIASALDYCHHNSVVHRDLKIENILIAEDGDIRLIDFGLSNLFRRDDLLRTFCGSLYFAAPELLNALPYVGPEIDVWSFGVVLYVLVCGKVPFEDKSMTVLHGKIKRGTVEYPQWLSSLCTDLLSRMLNVNPSERATLSEVMHHPWMLKGYDGPPESHLPRRLPLTADALDMTVIEEMAALGVGDVQTIHESLLRSLNSAEYHTALNAWYDKQSRDIADASSVTLIPRVPDPMDSFAPEISCYFLARERIAKASNIPTPVATPEGTISSDGTPVASANTDQVSSQQIKPSAGPELVVRRARARTIGSSTADTPGPQLASPVQTKHARHVQIGRVTPVSAAVPVDIVREEPPLPQLPETPKQQQQSRILSTPLPQTPQQQLQQQQQYQHQHQHQLSIFRKLSLRRKPHGHSRVKSTGHDVETFDNASRISQHSGGSQVSQNIGMPSIEAPKPVFFRGIFSVQSTSTKPLREIRAEIIRVLTRKNIEFAEIRGGFACVARYGESATAAAVANGTRTPSSVSRNNSSRSRGAGSLGVNAAEYATRRSNETPRYGDTLSVPQSPATPPATPKHRRMISDNGVVSPAVSLGGGVSSGGASSDSVEMEIGASDMLGEDIGQISIPVRFEIDIVRVPIVSLHGIQFKKMTGNVWQYKTLAQEILEELSI